MRELSSLRKSQWLDSARIKEFQVSNLKRIVNLGYRNIPYYRQKFSNEGIIPPKINSYDDFLKVPRLSKNDLNINQEALIAEDVRPKFELKLTSGSTGQPVRILKDRSAQARARGVMFRCYEWFGLPVGEANARFQGMPIAKNLRIKGRIKDLLANRIRIDVFDFTAEAIEKNYSNIMRFRPKYLYGYPSAVYEFLRRLDKKEKVSLSQIGIKLFISTAEMLHDFQKRYIEEKLNCRVVNEYGCCETGIIAFECPEGSLHLMSDNLFVEILNGDKPADPGQTGQLVVTELFNHVNPLIRYELGDFVKRRPEREYECPCGRSLQRIERVEGRISEMITLRDGRKVHSEIFDYISDEISKIDGGIRQYKITQKSFDEFFVQLVPSELFSSNTLIIFEACMKKYLGENIKVVTENVKEIHREESGKLRYFISHVN